MDDSRLLPLDGDYSLSFECFGWKILQERADQVRSSLTESHWTSHCVMTMERFQNLCGGFEEANVVMAYFLDCRRAQYLLIDREDHIEVKLLLLSECIDAF